MSHLKYGIILRSNFNKTIKIFKIQKSAIGSTIMIHVNCNLNWLFNLYTWICYIRKIILGNYYSFSTPVNGLENWNIPSSNNQYSILWNVIIFLIQFFNISHQVSSPKSISWISHVYKKNNHILSTKNGW